MLQEPPHYFRQSWMVQRLKRQKEYRRDFGGTRRTSTESPIRTSWSGNYQQQQNSRGLNGDGNFYPHIEVNSIQRAILGLGSAFLSIIDPKRGDMIATMGETTVC